ncbi:hypothetical protein A3B85_02450 [Candidatus Nomurabacteria bacterium RIFCSPHIGHO2_02_FULL_37_13]|uniref:UDP-N-acetylmuramate--L-alanine ligase n=1 Tax=Candidatus Nomurabacteria bacterium RIFCSPHIGHO2_02_FULL_37_13 TaxID=1801750 RepID=A0A1F6W4C2_9BACT|nr:MAG: hypothetical protein A2640_00650 [Candidatus Nomurabacteria bacterium RIFCSPHIGHO2_01_FULL_36_23]OGI76759.1 MAG: hypothetical protein A3B85_02450 [Candidatus Nomurabacteria bacterium RIFCSPHIGHO2_02_FULL_37_13]OGI88488.1 MAG: hypothetical protein A2906_00050 [Candidatus Nomurabacteria bacterium RIFCSPLOWO2_01_FULL_37_25]
MNIDLSKIKKVFFLGIGGIGVSAIARMMLLQGKSVFGSDILESIIVEDLRNLGAEIKLGQAIELIPKDIDLVIYSIAIPKYDPEFFKKLQNSGIQILSYPQMLGVVTANKYTIAVSGTHGKTTTTAMIAKILIDAGRDPSVVVGSLLKDYKSNFIAGESEFFVVEACEYERSFLNLKPKILVITNIEADHLDYYKNLADIQNAFDELISQSENAISASPIDSRSKDYIKYLEKIPKLSVPGLHNRMNAAAAFAVANLLGIKNETIQKSLAEFSGTWRRLEKKGKTKEGTIIYDDYAHHPTEIKASIEALRELYPAPKNKIIILFQPHLYSRTKALFDDFAKSFKGADRVMLLPIYFAREAKDESVSNEKLAKAITLAGDNAQAFPDFKSAEKAVISLNLGSKDIFVTMGAGEAYKVADNVFKMI